jgi:hypothetical protein
VLTDEPPVEAMGEEWRWTTGGSLMLQEGMPRTSPFVQSELRAAFASLQSDLKSLHPIVR